MPSQTCPNCSRSHDVGIYVSGQRVLCACGIRFEVRRIDVSMSGGRAVGSRVATTPARKLNVAANGKDGAAPGVSIEEPGVPPLVAEGAEPKPSNEAVPNPSVGFDATL